MQSLTFQLPAVLIEILALYFISRWTINELFQFFRIFIHDDHIVFWIISLIFLPGTIVHEFAHYFVALILFLNVREVKIFPELEANYIKLGKVLYEKKDVVRGVLVGLAPIFVGLIFFWWMSAFKLFPQPNILLNILCIYGIYTVSSSMFSSKQDLIDLVYILPFIALIIGIVYVFNIRLDTVLQNTGFNKALLAFIQSINLFILISLIINLGLLVAMKTIRFILRK